MTSLFINLYLDEDVNVLVADLLKARGFNVTTARSACQLQKSDAEQLLMILNHVTADKMENQVRYI